VEGRNREGEGGEERKRGGGKGRVGGEREECIDRFYGSMANIIENIGAVRHTLLRGIYTKRREGGEGVVIEKLFG
jgi:hypothetical protein